MKTAKTAVLCTALLALAGLLVAGCQKEGEAPTSPGAGAKPEIAQKTCPVMGGAIDPNIFVDHNGRRIYFCCPACVETFKADPEKYIAKVDEQLKGSGAATQGGKPENL